MADKGMVGRGAINRRYMAGLIHFNRRPCLGIPVLPEVEAEAGRKQEKTATSLIEARDNNGTPQEKNGRGQN